MNWIPIKGEPQEGEPPWDGKQYLLWAKSGDAFVGHYWGGIFFADIIGAGEYGGSEDDVTHYAIIEPPKD